MEAAKLSTTSDLCLVLTMPLGSGFQSLNFPIQKMGPGSTLGSGGQGWGVQQEEPAVCPWVSSSLWSVAGAGRWPEGPRLCGAGGRALLCPQVSPHASPGAQPPFLRKTELPKQINQSVRKKPWRKNLSTLAAKKLKRGIVPGDGGDNRHLLPGPFAWGSPPSTSWEHLGPGAPPARAACPGRGGREPLCGPALSSVPCPTRWGLSLELPAGPVPEECGEWVPGPARALSVCLAEPEGAGDRGD